jgi:hypothetical protein
VTGDAAFLYFVGLALSGVGAFSAVAFGVPALRRRFGRRYRIDVLHPRVVVVDTHYHNATVCTHALDLDDPTEALAKAHKDRDALEMAHRLARSGT